MIKRIAIICFFIFSCSGERDNKEGLGDEIQTVPFKILNPEDSGLKFSNDLTDTGDLNIIEYLYYYNGGGVALGDINNDGLDDIYLTANQKPDKLFLNLGNLKFKDISKESEISLETNWSTGATMTDVNNDGLLDIYVCKVGNYKGLSAHNELYVNQGNNKFKEEAASYGLNFSGFSTQASFFDYDNDGDMDVYLLNHSIHSVSSYGNKDLREKSDALAGDVLLENTKVNNQVTFVDVTEKAKIYNSALGYGLAISTSDVNNDGFIDIYVGNDFHENDYLYINNGDKTFKESSADYFNSTSRFTMGVDIADMTNNGKLDIMTLDMMPYKADIFLKSGGEDSDKVNQIKNSFGFQQQYARNHLQLNQGDYFADAALLTETHATDWSWSPLLLDYNNDGLNDIYITNGIYKRPNDLDYIKYISTVDFANYADKEQDTIELKLIEAMPTLKLPNSLFTNQGNLTFDNTKADTKNEGTYSNGAAYSDLDNDGDLDIVVNNLNDNVTVLENSTSNNYLTIQLIGENGSLNTNGAKVILYSEGSTLYKEQVTVKGFLSSSTAKVHFGLANATKVDSLKVVWLDGTETIKTDLKINSIVKVKKEDVSESQLNKRTAPKISEFDYQHFENGFLDYEQDGLMPERLSIEGPSAVQADFNGDGLKDLFIGGARNQKPVLYFMTKEGKLEIQDVAVLKSDAMYEDTDAIALDIDNDNDLDIYALSGGNDYQEGHPLLEDRVYLNDGNGNFSKLKAKLITTNGATVSSYDYDKDGLVDLFIGNRSLPGAYGLSPQSFVLKNKGNNSFEIVAKYRFGMITDSKWADLNNDGLTELIMVGDWMPITVLSYNAEGKFENKTKEFGFDKSNGMWNTIEVADINSDGQPDILAGNTGLNFKWKASKEKPVIMYLDDFDENEKLDQLIFYDFFGTYVPFASKDKLVEQLPSLKKKYTDYKSFSNVEKIGDLTDKPESEIINIKYLYELRSMAYINKGDQFIPNELPKEAQLSTIEDFLIDDNQILFTGNYDGFITELGQSSSNSGGLINISDQESMSYQPLNLPRYINGRKLVKINENEYLIITNGGKSYLLNR
ncbi:VCBS repeat-containing protein [Winogradskyella sp. PE311]|uniref:VCBS repeat-containing protein n=1 Tax=Winogradskyella sp. PE311 TaxID=3366943 RepID=UPI00397ED841